MLGAIAKHNGVTLKALLAANPGVNPTHMKIGQKITIPAPSATPATEPASSSRNATTRGSSKIKKKTKSATTRPAVAGGTYTIKKGDTLRKIAKSVYGDENMWQRIFRANRGDLASPNDITTGEVIKLPSTKRCSCLDRVLRRLMKGRSILEGWAAFFLLKHRNMPCST